MGYGISHLSGMENQLPDNGIVESGLGMAGSVVECGYLTLSLRPGIEMV